MMQPASLRAVTEAARVQGIDLDRIGIDADEAGCYEIEVIYQGSLDETFTVLPDYAMFVTETVARSVAEEYERDADKVLGWSVTCTAEGAPFGTPPVRRIQVVEMDAA